MPQDMYCCEMNALIESIDSTFDQNVKRKIVMFCRIYNKNRNWYKHIEFAEKLRPYFYEIDSMCNHTSVKLAKKDVFYKNFADLSKKIYLIDWNFDNMRHMYLDCTQYWDNGFPFCAKSERGYYEVYTPLKYMNEYDKRGKRGKFPVYDGYFSNKFSGLSEELFCNLRGVFDNIEDLFKVIESFENFNYYMRTRKDEVKKHYLKEKKKIQDLIVDCNTVINYILGAIHAQSDGIDIESYKFENICLTGNIPRGKKREICIS